MQAELRFLHSKPTCFIVLGKPGAGKTSICQKISQEWNCEHVNGKFSLEVSEMYEWFCIEF